jgi:hypothetical protein
MNNIRTYACWLLTHNISSLFNNLLSKNWAYFLLTVLTGYYHQYKSLF